MTKHIGDIEYGTEMTGKEMILSQARRIGLHAAVFDPARQIYDTNDATYHVKKLEEIEAMSVEDIETKQAMELQAEMNDYAKKLEEVKELRAKYEKLHEEVKLWEPPTEEHEKLKDKALKEIEEYIDWKCARFEQSTPPSESPFRLSAEKYKEMMTQHHKEQIQYYKNKYKEEQERIAESKKYMEQLLESLPE